MKRLILLALVVGALGLGVGLARAAVAAKAVRERPERTSVIRMLNAWGPARTLYLYLLLRPGDRLYHAAILPWLYGERVKIADTPWNRRILEAHLLATPKDLALTFAPSYPLRPGPRLHPLLFEAVHAGEHRALQVLDRSEEGRRLVAEWLQKEIVVTQDAELFAQALPTLLRLEAIDLPALLTALMPRLAATRKTLPLDVDETRAILQASPGAPGLAAWVRDGISRRQVTVAFAMPLLAALLTTPSTRDATGDFLLNEAPISGPELLELVGPPDCLASHDDNCKVPAGLPTAVVRRAFELTSRKPDKFLELFHALLHAEDERAAPIATPVLQAGDSEIRKGVVVLLSNHYAQQPSYSLDDAFEGAAPRTLLFHDIHHYDTTAAIREYQQLAGHAYRRVGKRFPPYLGGRIPTLADAAAWREFIAKYPWFPATDDAVYRLAHVYFLGGEFELAAATLAGFDPDHFVDSDIAPYVDLLAQVNHAALAPTGPEEASGIAVNAGRADWLRWYDGQEVHRIENAVLAVDWLLAHEALAARLGVERPYLERLRLALDSVRERCLDEGFNTCHMPAEAADLLRQARATSSSSSDASPYLEFTLNLLEALLG